VFFDIGPLELIALAVIALLVVGPDKLPRYAADAARMLRQVRRLANDAKTEMSRELGPELQDISMADLNPRTFVRKHLREPSDLDDPDDLDVAGRSSDPAGAPRDTSRATASG
jgi:sec-independent protein translocase protein TatB